MRPMHLNKEAGERLTRLQAGLREYLRVHSGQNISRQQLCAAVWRMNYFHPSRTIDQTVSVVRKHLHDEERIVTVFGVGYRHEFATDARPAFARRSRV